MTGDLAHAEVTPIPRPEKTAKKRGGGRTAASARWHEAIMRQDEAIYTADEPAYPSLQAHHVVYRQVCRQHGAPEWDERNGAVVSGRRHARHHSGHEPIRWDELSPLVRLNTLAFAAEFGFLPWLERHLVGFAAPVSPRTDGQQE